MPATPRRFTPRPLPRLRLRGREIRPLTVFPPDGRTIYNDTSFPWGNICRVIMDNDLGGTGCIVGPRHVRTASHVIDWKKPGTGKIEVHRALLTKRAVTPIIAAWTIAKLTSAVGWTEVDEDFTVLVTKERIGDQFGWFGVRTYDSSWDDDDVWINIGYPGSILNGLMPTVQKARWLNEHDFDYGPARAMSTNADLSRGNSGGPMFRFWPKGPYVVAVVSGEDEKGTVNYCAGGGAMTSLVRHAQWLFP
jgi:V8-like Glu-specific endopeptidase